MSRQISQWDLRNHSEEIMRALDRGEEFVVTRNGVPVGELRPVRRRFVAGERLATVFSGAPPVSTAGFREEVDQALDHRIDPRA